MGCEPVLKAPTAAAAGAGAAPAAVPAGKGKAPPPAVPTDAAAAPAVHSRKKGKKTIPTISWKDLSADDTLNLSTKVFSTANDMLDKVKHSLGHGILYISDDENHGNYF